ncbi:MAG: SAM-dependent methyltransferase [Chloroflexi bacterium]|nr:SAM-dependent methyltransferase [Chloroflexota bacterium]
MAKNRGKSTAAGVAAMRAIGALEDDPSVRNPDYLAARLLPTGLRLLLAIRPLARMILKQYHRLLPGNYYLHIVRTKHIDAILKERCGQGIRQLVILGAGFDTRAYRFREILKDVKVFEIDHPGTQATKKARAARLPGGTDVSVTYVPVDFNNQQLDVLFESGYSEALPTLFVWEGVCMYITPQAVDETLSFVKRHSGTGSTIVFDYIFRSMVEGKCDYYGARESAAFVAKRGEPYTFGIEEGAIQDFLRSRGFRLLSEFTPLDMEQTYLKTVDGTVRGKVCGYTNVVHAAKE